ncbi:hypothetical protein ACQ86B_19085 [Mycolicibacterium aichiense]|uniref:hypothetical protein n=1 Tax=Mycolicibacterium aichiense TaxID=1799 RepID=UPI003D66FB1B
MVSSALTAGAFTAAPTAHANCFSAFGLNNGNGCTSNLTTLAIAIGPGATANAGNALFGGAIAIGNGASALTNIAAFNFAGAFGDGAVANTLGAALGINLQFGPGTSATLGGVLNFLLGAAAPGSTGAFTNAIGFGNVVTQIGAGTAAAIGGLNLVLGLPNGGTYQSTGASGIANLAIQIGAGTVSTIGLLNVALSILHNGGGVQTTTVGGIGAWGLNLLGDGEAFWRRASLRPPQTYWARTQSPYKGCSA